MKFNNPNPRAEDCGTNDNPIIRLQKENCSLNMGQFHQELDVSNTLTTFPNPFTNEINVIIPEKLGRHIELELISLSSNSIRIKQNKANVENSNEYSINTESIPSGLYLLKVSTEGKKYHIKVIKP